MKTNTLVKRALKNGPKWKPAKGMMYLKDLPIGKMFMTEMGTRGVLISCEVNAKVIILSTDVSDEDSPYYLGKRIIGAKTEIYKDA